MKKKIRSGYFKFAIFCLTMLAYMFAFFALVLLFPMKFFYTPKQMDEFLFRLKDKDLKELVQTLSELKDVFNVDKYES